MGPDVGSKDSDVVVLMGPNVVSMGGDVVAGVGVGEFGVLSKDGRDVAEAVTLFKLFVISVLIGKAVVDVGVLVVEETPGWVLATTVHNETQIV